ncbi:PREDICTED: SCAN domain-containing protein 3-like [Priapulus caudatus]|uniref:SCAN domain-containing protein 3-like n=1 Tax=Priapulus caudatus TaxID=37621 RepID=A0ABM1ETD7_PRICU|nr:PREDICTED: SCAN domain-containing protein 3-like [Priapulus caudatus]
MVADDLKDQLFKKLHQAVCYGLQLDEKTDESKTTAQAIFDKLTEFLDEGDVQLDKCKAMTTDGAAAMTGRVNGLVQKTQAVSPTCVATHCMIHREALAAKPIGSDKTEKNELELILEDVVKIVNAVKANTKKHRMFSKLCKDMDAEFSKLPYHRNGGDVFITISKVQGFEKKIEQWKRRAENANFSDFHEVQTFMRGSNWWVMENEEKSLQQVVTRLVVDHLTLLQSNFNKYFPEEEK